MLYFGKVISFIFLPPGLCVVFFLLGILFFVIGQKHEKARRKAIVFMVLGAILFIVCSLTPVADFLIRPLEDKYSALPALDSINKYDYKDCYAVAILGGGNIESSPEEGTGKASPSDSALKRIAYGVRLAKSLDIPVIFSGGVVYATQEREPEALAAKRYIQGLGIDPARIMLDATSKSTWENAENIKKLIAENKPEASNLIVVTSAFHMPRAMLSFAKQGLTIVPAPTDYLATRVPLTWQNWFPSADAMEKSFIALHEYLGLLQYSMRSKAKSAE